MSGYLENFVDNDEATRVRVERDGNQARLMITSYDTDSWTGADEATLDRIGLRALAALCLIVAQELERDL